MKYKCVSGFSVFCVDDNGFSIENKYLDVKKDTIWDLDDSENRMIGGEIKLEREVNEKTFQWIEITKETFESCFEAILESETNE
jgi:hypothetical protein